MAGMFLLVLNVFGTAAEEFSAGAAVVSAAAAADIDSSCKATTYLLSINSHICKIIMLDAAAFSCHSGNTAAAVIVTFAAMQICSSSSI